MKKTIATLLVLGLAVSSAFAERASFDATRKDIGAQLREQDRKIRENVQDGRETIESLKSDVSLAIRDRQKDLDARVRDHNKAIHDLKARIKYEQEEIEKARTGTIKILEEGLKTVVAESEELKKLYTSVSNMKNNGIARSEEEIRRLNNSVHDCINSSTNKVSALVQQATSESENVTKKLGELIKDAPKRTEVSELSLSKKECESSLTRVRSISDAIESKEEMLAVAAGSEEVLAEKDGVSLQKVRVN